MLQLMGSEPLFVLKLILPSGTRYLFSTQEICPDEYTHISDFEGLPIRNYVESFGQYSQTESIANFGAISTCTIRFNDLFGLFKNMLEHTNLYDIQAELYLFVKQKQYPSTAQLIIKGRLAAPINWYEGDRQLEVDIVSGVIFYEFGFVPQFLGVQGIEKNLYTDPWPHIFGTVRLYDLQAFCNVPTVTIQQNLYFLRYLSERRFPNPDPEQPPIILPEGYPSYDNDANNKFYNPGIPLSSITVNEDGQLPADMGELYSIEIPGGNVLFKATAVNNTLQIGSEDWNLPWYSNIVTWSPPQYGFAYTYRRDDDNYIPNVVVMQGYGTFDLPDPGQWQFDIYDQLISPAVLTIKFPIDNDVGGGQPGWWSDLSNWENGLNTPWLKDMYIHILGAYIYRNSDNEPDVQTIELWAKVINQQGLMLYLDEFTRYDNAMEVTISGIRVLYIYEAVKNKIFKLYSHELRDRPPINIQRMQDNTEVYLDHRYAHDGGEDWFGVYDAAFLIPAGSEIKAVSWWANRMYPITLDIETEPIELYLEIGKRLMQIDATSQFALFRYSRYDEFGAPRAIPFIWYDRSIKGSEFWQFVTPLNSPLPSGLWDLAIYNPDEFPDEFTFALLYKGSYLQMLKDLGGEEALTTLKLYAENPYDTDEKVAEYTIEKYTTFLFTQNADLTKHHPVAFGMREKDADIKSFIATLAYEHAKQTRVILDDVNFVDLLDADPTTNFTFSERFIDARSIQLTYTGDESIENYLQATAEFAPGSLVLKDAQSIARYTERKKEITLKTNQVYDGEPEDPMGYELGDPACPGWESGAPGYVARGYNRVLYYWLRQSANSWLSMAFNTYLDAANFTVGDVININLTQTIEFQDPHYTGVLKYPIGAAGSWPVNIGRVKEITVNPDDWQVSVLAELPIKLGEG